MPFAYTRPKGLSVDHSLVCCTLCVLLSAIRDAYRTQPLAVAVAALGIAALLGVWRLGSDV